MMEKLKKIFVLVLIVAFVSVGLTSCNNKDEHPSGEHPNSVQPSEEHPKGEEPSEEHPKGEEQPKSEHPTSEHPE